MFDEVDLKALEKLYKWEEDYINKSDNNIFKNAMEKTGKALKPITIPVAKKNKANHR